MEVGGAHVVLPSALGRPATLYFVIDVANDPENGVVRSLEGVRVEGVERAEMHRSMTMDGMAQMRPLASVPLTDGTTRFCPGGYHVMLFGLSPKLKPGAQTRVHLRLSDGKHLDPDAMVVEMGDAVQADAPYACPAP